MESGRTLKRSFKTKMKVSYFLIPKLITNLQQPKQCSPNKTDTDQWNEEPRNKSLHIPSKDIWQGYHKHSTTVFSTSSIEGRICRITKMDLYTIRN
jgi:hypothetical protein